jgi:hypothetical protein
MSATVTVVTHGNQEVWDASELAPVEFDGQWFAWRSMFPDEVEACQYFEAETKRQAESRARFHELHTPGIGWRIPEIGAILRTYPNADGEMVADCVGVIRTTAKPVGAAGTTVVTKPGLAIEWTQGVSIEGARRSRGEVALIARHLTLWISGRRGPVTEEHRQVHQTIRTLLTNELMQSDAAMPSAPKSLREGVETPAGMIDRASMIRPGTSVYTTNDAMRANEGNDMREGGIVIAVESHATGRTLTIIKPDPLGWHWLGTGHIDADTVHWCDDHKPCGLGPEISRQTITTWRAIHKWLYRGCVQRGAETHVPFSLVELRWLNVATTILGATL